MKYFIMGIIVLLSTVAFAGDRFEVDSEGVIYDNETGLYWYCFPRVTYLSFSQASSRIDALNEQRVPAGSNWRMPTLEELEVLYYNAGITRQTPSPFIFSERLNTKVYCINSSGDPRKLAFNDGSVFSGSQSNEESVWAVRD